MPNKSYAKGVRFEREVVNAFKTDGAICSRSAGSHGAFDIVAYTDQADAAAKIHQRLDGHANLTSKWGDNITYWQGHTHKILYWTCLRQAGEWVWLLQAKVLKR